MYDATLNKLRVRNIALWQGTDDGSSASDYSIGLGQDTLVNNTTGPNNTAIGYSALMNNTT